MIKLTFLLEKKNNWIVKKVKNSNFSKKFRIKISYDSKKIINEDIVIILSYTKILDNQFLQSNKLNLVVHSSNLPENKGFAPLSYQILNHKRKIFNTIFKINEKVDSGDYYFKNYFSTNGTELYDELRDIQGNSIMQLIKKFLNKYPNVKSFKQKGFGNFNKRRKPEDSKLNIDKNIKSQFNLLRICDNEKFPAFFIYKKKKYILKIFKYKKNQ